MTIVKRGTKGTALSYAEMDENIRDLYEDTTIDRVLGNGNTTTKDITVANLTSTTLITGSIISDTLTTSGSSFSSTLSDSKGEVRILPLVAAASRTLIASDHGKVISATGTITVPPSIFSVGQTITVYNNSVSSISISRGSGVVMYWAQTGADANRSLGQRGIATLLCVESNTFVITGGTLT
jgi:hypothetical protein